MDEFMLNYKRLSGEPRVMFLSRWYYIWPAAGEMAHAYREWATVCAVPFPMKEKGVSFQETYMKLIEFFDPQLLHLGPTYYGNNYISYDFLRRFKAAQPYHKIIATHAETTVKGNRMRTFTQLPNIVDIVYTVSPSLVRTIKKASGCNNVRFLPTAVDHEAYHPVDVEKQFDLLFLGYCGGSKKSRDEVIIKLDRDFADLWVGGSWWDQYNLRHHFPGAFRANFNEWNSRARIDLCLIPDEHKTLEQYYTYRLTNTMATQTFAMTSYTPGLEKLFTRKVHLDWYETYDELVALLKYWLAHDKEREQVARQGREHVLKHFTLKQQTRQLLVDVGILL